MSFSFSFFSSFVGILSSTAAERNTGSCVPQIPDDEIPELVCNGVACWSYPGQRKEYSARGTYLLEYTKHDSSSRLGVTPG